MQVMGYGTQIIEKFAVNGPALVFSPERGADHALAFRGNRILEQNALSVGHHDKAEALVGSAVFIHSHGGRRDPALVDAAAVRAVGVKVARVQLQTSAGNEIRSGNPGRSEVEHAFAFLECLVDAVGGGRCKAHVNLHS